MNLPGGSGVTDGCRDGCYTLSTVVRDPVAGCWRVAGSSGYGELKPQVRSSPATPGDGRGIHLSSILYPVEWSGLVPLPKTPINFTCCAQCLVAGFSFTQMLDC